MYFCEETGEFIHPVFFDAEEEAREVRAASANDEVCSQYQVLLGSVWCHSRRECGTGRMVT